MTIPTIADGHLSLAIFIPEDAPEFIRDVTGPMIAGYGESLPVSAMPIDGSFPVGSAKWEKRNIALEVPVWDTDLCFQCGKCVLVCPHSAIRGRRLRAVASRVGVRRRSRAPRTAGARLADRSYSLQVAVEDCTGCELCVEVCPEKDKANPEYRAINMAPQLPLREADRADWDFFLSLPVTDRLQGMESTT